MSKTGKDVTKFKPGVEELAELVNKIITFDKRSFDFDLNEIIIPDNSWKIRE